MTHAINTGTLHDLPGGADHAVLAGRTQDAWDLTLLRGHSVVGHVQVKFSDSDNTILVHLHDHPGVPWVIANHEAAAVAHRHGADVIDSHIGYASIHKEVSDTVGDHIGAAHFAHEWLPETAGVVILGTALLELWRGVPSAKVATWAKEQLALAGAANATATIASIVTGHELVRIPAAMGARFWLARATVSRDAAVWARRTRDQVSRLAHLSD